MILSSLATDWLVERVKRYPEVFVISTAVVALATLFIFPHMFGAKGDVDHNKQVGIMNHKLVVKALCGEAQINLTGQEQSVQNEIYSLEQSLYQVERYQEEGSATPRDLQRRDQIKIQIQKLKDHLHTVQRREIDLPSCLEKRSNAG